MDDVPALSDIFSPDCAPPADLRARALAALAGAPPMVALQLCLTLVLLSKLPPIAAFRVSHDLLGAAMTAFSDWEGRE